MDDKIKWSVASAMANVCDSVNNSKLELGQNSKCKLAVQRLSDLYKISELQTWILCVVCKNYIDNKKDTAAKGLAKYFGVPASLAKGWKNDIEDLKAKGFLRSVWPGGKLRPTGQLCNSIFTNTLYVPQQKRKLDGIGLSYAFYIGSKKSDVDNMDKSCAKTMEFASDFLGLKMSLKMAMNLVR
ncbi:MAG: hypothetical protein VZQ47_09815 [Treponema sp.]|nr:hypothetical protein [Treponema sp.]MEE3435839.1 hypothetical protein [Treponema sp.]